MISLDRALEQLLAEATAVTQTETVATVDGLGRVLAEAVVSSVAVPPLDNSEMDGYAVRCADLPAVPATLPVSQRIQAGQVGGPLAAASAARIFTGAPIPPGCDAIVPQESTQLETDRVVVMAKPAPCLSIVTPCTMWNWPGAVPRDPNSLRYFPSLSKRTMRPFL